MSTAPDEAWFSSLGTPLGEAENADIAAYLEGLGMPADLPIHAASTWDEAADLCQQPAGLWWQAEEAERARLERSGHLDPANAAWLQMTERLHGAAAIAAARFGCADSALIRVAAGAATYAAYQQRLAQKAGVDPSHPFLRKYALYCAGHWPLGVYDERFAIF